MTCAQHNTLLQDFGEFTVATADIIRPAPDCNCINTGRWVDSEVI